MVQIDLMAADDPPAESSCSLRGAGYPRAVIAQQTLL